jgi:hypothetical protein
MDKEPEVANHVLDFYTPQVDFRQTQPILSGAAGARA